jgi:adenylosuccinate synthase
LSDEAKSFIKNIESKLQVSVTLIGTGPLVDDVIDIRSD